MMVASAPPELTTNYGFKKPALGSLGWGEDVNENFDLIDSQIKANELAGGYQKPEDGIPASDFDADVQAILDSIPAISAKMTPEAYVACYRAMRVPPQPNAGNTGYGDANLSAYLTDFTTTSDGQVIEHLDIAGKIIINGHKNVVIKENKIAKQIDLIGNDLFPLIIDNKIGSETVGVNYEAAIGDGGFYAIRNDISGFGDGLKMGAGNAAACGNYIHDLYRYSTGGGTYIHCDGIQISGLAAGVENIDILGNAIDTHSYGAGGDSVVSGVLCKADFGNISRVHIEKNYVYGGAAYAFEVLDNSDAASGPYWQIPDSITIRGNFLGQTFGNGYYNLDDTTIPMGNFQLEADGSIGPMIEGIPGTGNAIRLDGTSGGSKVSTPWVASRLPTGAFTIVADVAPAIWASGASQVIISQADQIANTTYSWKFWIGSSGNLAFRWQYNNSGGGIQVVTSRVMNFAAWTRKQVAVKFVPNSATSYTVTFYVSEPGVTITDSHRIESFTATVTSGQTTIYDANTPITVGCRTSSGAAQDRYNGNINSVVMRDTDFAGTIKLAFTPALTKMVNRVSPSPTGSSGEVWTLPGAAYYTAPRPKASMKTGLPIPVNGQAGVTVKDFVALITQLEQFLAPTPTEVTADYKMLGLERRLYVTPGASNVNITAAPLAFVGVTFKVVKLGAGAGNVVLIDQTGSTIATLTTQYDRLEYESKGASYLVDHS